MSRRGGEGIIIIIIITIIGWNYQDLKFHEASGC
jgi:hypothetical protein